MDVEFDDRMSEETVEFLKKSFKISRPGDLLKMDIKLVRKIKDDAARALSELVKFDDLNITEIYVKSKEDNHDIPVTIYAPKNLPISSPITVFFHGGGFCLGSRITYHHTVAFLSRKTKSTWLSVDYRRCPDEGKYPTPFLDCKNVVEWAIQNKNNLTSNESKIGICGDSSGGQIASIIAHELKLKLDFQILIYPVVNFFGIYESFNEFQKECFMLIPPVIEFFINNIDENPSEHADHLSTVMYPDFKNLPKCLLIAAELDPFVDHSKHYYNKLKEENIECRFEVLKGCIHGYFNQPLMFTNAFKDTEDFIDQFFQTI